MLAVFYLAKCRSMGKEGKEKKEDKEKASKKDKKKEKKQKKKEKKLAKKAKKAAKKAEKAKRKVELALDGLESRPAKKSRGSSSSSSSSSSGSSVELNFVMDKSFSTSGGLDPRNPDAKIQRALGLTCGNFGFVEREDDAATAKEHGHQRDQTQDKTAEDRSRDWICQKAKATGEPCNSRNFVKNEFCYKCGAMQPRQSNVLQSRDVKGSKMGRGDRQFFR